MSEVRTVADWMSQRGLDLTRLVEVSGLEARIVAAIVHGRYTPSPQQRQRLAAALGLAPEQIAWGHQGAGRAYPRPWPAVRPQSLSAAPRLTCHEPRPT